MPKYKALMLSATLALALPGIAQAQSETAMAAEVTADTVIASVNGTEITVGHLIASVPDLAPEDQQLPDEVLFEGLIERLIQQTAVSQSQQEMPSATRLRLENQRNQLVASDVVERMAAAIEVSDADVQAAYDVRFADFTPATEYNASHILVATEAEAGAVIEALDGGADFAEQAREKSTGPSGPNGGALGWFGAGRMVPEFEQAVVEMEVGAISQPVQTQFGWHVIKLNETRIPSVPALDTMRGELQTEVFRQQLFAEIDALVGKAEIVRADVSGIDPAVLRNMALIGR